MFFYAIKGGSKVTNYIRNLQLNNSYNSFNIVQAPQHTLVQRGCRLVLKDEYIKCHMKIYANRQLHEKKIIDYETYKRVESKIQNQLYDIDRKLKKESLNSKNIECINIEKAYKL